MTAALTTICYAIIFSKTQLLVLLYFLLNVNLMLLSLSLHARCSCRIVNYRREAKLVKIFADNISCTPKSLNVPDRLCLNKEVFCCKLRNFPMKSSQRYSHDIFGLCQSKLCQSILLKITLHFCLRLQKVKRPLHIEVS